MGRSNKLDKVIMFTQIFPLLYLFFFSFSRRLGLIFSNPTADNLFVAFSHTLLICLFVYIVFSKRSHSILRIFSFFIAIILFWQLLTFVIFSYSPDHSKIEPVILNTIDSHQGIEFKFLLEDDDGTLNVFQEKHVLGPISKVDCIFSSRGNMSSPDAFQFELDLQGNTMTIEHERLLNYPKTFEFQTLGFWNDPYCETDSGRVQSTHINPNVFE